MAASSIHQRIVLPSIHEMFPEYLLPRAAPPAVVFRGRVAPQVPHVHQPPFSFDVLKSDPRGASLQHIASSRSGPPAPHHPASSSPTRSLSSDGDTEMDSCEGDVDGDLDSEESASSTYEGRKHPCPTCGKRFNRPSSLRIHVNTHTGATPFRCPHPNCGRAFNVNSNMKRHYRNHTVAAASAASSGTTVTSPRARARVPTTPSPSLSPSRSPSRSPSPLSPSVATAPLSTAAKVYRYSESDVRSQRR